jgi:hypothetical protein
MRSRAIWIIVSVVLVLLVLSVVTYLGAEAA